MKFSKPGAEKPNTKLIASFPVFTAEIQVPEGMDTGAAALYLSRHAAQSYLRQSILQEQDPSYPLKRKSGCPVASVKVKGTAAFGVYAASKSAENHGAAVIQ